MLKTAFITSVLFLTACAPTYQYERKSGMPTATITRNADSVGGNILFAIDDDGQCPLLGYVKDDKQLDISIPTGKKIWVQVGYNTWGAPYGQLCMIKESFIPKENEHYYSEFKVIPGGCSLTISRYTENGTLVPEESVAREKYEMCMY